MGIDTFKISQIFPAKMGYSLELKHPICSLKCLLNALKCPPLKNDIDIYT